LLSARREIAVRRSSSILEMTRLIDVNRAYTSLSSMMAAGG
jgi:hypothetical protein